MNRRHFWVVIIAVGVGLAPTVNAGEIAVINAGPTVVSWQSLVNHEGAVLTVSGPDGVTRLEFDRAQAPSFAVATEDDVLADGEYTYELRFEPVVDRSTRELLNQARANGNADVIEELKRTGKIPNEQMVTSGYIHVRAGRFVYEDLETEIAHHRPETVEHVEKGGEAPIDRDVPLEDQVILDDLIVDGSACIGFDCVNGESFGFDTIRLKENNTRIKFQDTSSSASFPSNDWQLTANDSTNGGANKFSIDDIDGSRTPFTIEASAPSHSLYVDDGGRLGLGTSTPVVDIHAVSGNTPTLRLEQNGSSGFTAQTWDVAGNEAGFFIRDVTNGSTLPFRIRPGAASSVLDISADDEVGINSTSPDATLHVVGNAKIAYTDDGLAPAGQLHLLIDAPDQSGTALFMENTAADGQTIFQMLNGFGDQWAFRAQNNGFGINFAGNAGLEFRLDEAGDVYLNGVLHASSSRAMKHDFANLDPLEVLAKVVALPIFEWSYNDQNSRHIGPVAEDFYSTFGLGTSDEHIAISDISGVSMSAIKGLYGLLETKTNEIDELRAENESLNRRLEALERALLNN